MQFRNRTQIATNNVTQLYRAFLIQQDSDDVEVIVKTITLTALGDEADLDREALVKRLESLQMLDHPHIFPLLDLRFNDHNHNQIQQVMTPAVITLLEQLPGKGYSISRAQAIFTQVAQGLHYAHEAGVLHLNLKPQNVLFDDVGNACLSDFSVIPPDVRKSKLYATPAYLAPEQINGEPLSVQTDIYALGCLLYTLLTGTPPFSIRQGIDEVAVLNKQLMSDPVLPSKINSVLPKAIDSVIARALAKAPEARYESIAQFEQAVVSAFDHANQRSRSVPTPAITIPLIVRPFIVAFFFMAVAIIALIFSLRNVPESPTRKIAAAPQILMGTNSPSDTLTVSAQENELAVASLGEGGFIAYITCNRSSEYYATIAREVLTFAQAADLPVLVYDGQNDAFRQPILIEQARVDGAQGFIVCPLNLDALADALGGLVADNIPLVLTAGIFDGAVVVHEDDTLLGEPIGEYAGRYIRDELSGQAQVVVLNYPQLPNLIEREQAMVAGMFAFAPSAEIVSTTPGATVDGGYDSVNFLLETNTSFNVILSINDAGTYGAIEALEEAGIAPNAVAIFSVDAELRAQQYIRENYFLRASISAGRQESARAIVNSMVKLLSGSPIAETIQVPPGEIITIEDVN
ncbi:MAG: substrate-binding domain-containing protein [Aggregatilineales bacterium]